MASCNRVGSFLQSPFQLFRTAVAVAAATAVAVARTCRVVSSIYVSSSGDEAESVCETEIIACSDLIYCQTKKKNYPIDVTNTDGWISSEFDIR